MNASGIIRTALAGVLLSVASLAAVAAQLVVPAGATVTLPSGTLNLACADLIVQGTISVGASQVLQGGSVNIHAAATLDGGTGSIAVGGNWANAGTFTRGASSVVFEDGCTTSAAQIAGTTAFTNLTFTSAAGRTFVIPSGNTISVFGQLTLTGAAGLPIQIVSANPAQPTTIVLGPSATVSSSNFQLGTNLALDGTAIPRLFGISTRVQVLTGDNVMIGGFIIEGTVPKTVVVRARGTSLGVAGALADPTMTVVPAAGGPLLTNDDWGTAANAAELAASGFAPAHAKESAVMATLNPGAYTAIVGGVGNTTGIAIVEVYELDHAEIQVIGISTRGLVQTGDNVMIGGFIIQGSAAQTVVIRARGPSLGVAGALADPVLTLVPAAGGPTTTNDDWQTAANAATLSAIGYAPSDPKESAILITLSPGAYTAIVTGAGGSTGIAIVEVYDAP